MRVDNLDPNTNPVLAYVSVVLEEEFVVHDIRLIQGSSRVFLSMPSKEISGSRQDIAHPITDVCRERILRKAIASYNQEVPESEKLPTD